MALRLTWSARRQLLYYTVGIVICAALAWILYSIFLTTAPTCFDNEQNQNERGVDCGGVCSLVCKADQRPLVVLWSRPFEVAPGYYSAAAYVRNDNLTAGAKGVRYSFQLFDDNNLLVVEREGRIDVPPVSAVPIVESNIAVGNRSVARALFSFVSEPVWRTAAVPALRVTNQELAADGSRLSATIVNDGLAAVRRATITAVLYDVSGTARAASKSLIDIPAKGSQAAVFTWPLGNTSIVRAEITVLPPF